MLNPNSPGLQTIRDKIAAGFYQNRVRVLAEAGSDDAEIQRESWAKQDKICFDNFFKDIADLFHLYEDFSKSAEDNAKNVQPIKDLLWNLRVDFQCGYLTLLKYTCDLLIMKDESGWTKREE